MEYNMENRGRCDKGQERVAILEDASIENAELKEFQNKPYLLFYEDIEADTNNWKNVRMSSYYRKNLMKA